MVTLGAPPTSANPVAIIERERRNECILEKNNFYFVKNYVDKKKSRYSNVSLSILIEKKERINTNFLHLNFRIHDPSNSTGSKNQELTPKLISMKFRICLWHKVAELEHQKALCRAECESCSKGRLF
jgi:hypothetical protein